MDRCQPPGSQSESTGQATPVVSSTDLLRGAREARIAHGHEVYRLLLTKSNKLILIK